LDNLENKRNNIIGQEKVGLSHLFDSYANEKLKKINVSDVVYEDENMEVEKPITFGVMSNGDNNN